MWFCSLFFSLLSALGASLAKSWVAEYAQVQHKPNAEDAYHRHRRYLGISSWRLADVITTLPILLHTSFFLFSVGLVILLFGDYTPIGALTLILTAVALILYLGTAAIPVLLPDCPYQTPVTMFLMHFAGGLFNSRHHIPPALSDTSKAQLLLWLHYLCDGSGDVDEIITAIAGLDPSPDVQSVLHNSSFAIALCDHLSSANVQPNSQVQKAYLYAVLNILSTGFPHLGTVEEQETKPAFLQLITKGGPLYDCGLLPVGVQEIAICIKARIVLIYRLDTYEQIFDITIPLLLNSTTEGMYRQMLQEVYVLHLDTTTNTLAKLHGEHKLFQREAYNDIHQRAKGKYAFV
jgi:hypothetical protein